MSPGNQQSLRKRVADWILVGAVALGLASPVGLLLLLPALFVRGIHSRIKWRVENTLILLAGLWGVLVIIIRADSISSSSLFYFLFIWSLPHILTYFRPDEFTLNRFGRFVLLLFSVDLFFNVGTLVTGADLLGRSLDPRDGIISGRLGGVFAHSFYSGSISLIALLTLISKNRSSWLVFTPVLNLLLAGSWRFSLSLLVVSILAIGWRRRTRRMELALVVAFSTAAIAAIAVTSDLFPILENPNGANTLRVFAWLTSTEKIASSPWTGVGYPNTSAAAEEGISFESLDENLIAESWYLDSAITFGLPYTALYLGSLLVAFWGSSFETRGKVRAILYPFALIDLTYGSFIGSMIAYFWIWLLILTSPSPKDGSVKSGL